MKILELTDLKINAYKKKEGTNWFAPIAGSIKFNFDECSIGNPG